MSDSVIIEPITKDDHHGLFRLVAAAALALQRVG